MNDQNVNSTGDNNTFNQFNGDVSLTSLGIEGLAREDRLAQVVVRSERTRRFRGGAVLAAIALVIIVCTYVFLVRRNELTFADIFNNFGSAMTGPLLGVVVSGVLALGVSAASVRTFSGTSEVERENLERRVLIEKIALSKGHRPSQWRRAKKGVRKSDPRP